MGQAMTVKECARWLELLGTPEARSGWKRENRAVGRHLVKVHKKRVRKNVNAFGVPWKPMAVKPKPAVGGTAAMLVEKGGKVVKSKRSGVARLAYRKLRNRRDKKRAMEWRKKFGPPWKRTKALVRRSAKGPAPKATKILDHLSNRHKALRIYRDGLTYGFRQSWVRRLHFGGAVFGTDVPSREIVGMNTSDVNKAMDIYADGWLKRAKKANP